MFGKSKLLVLDTDTEIGQIAVNQDALDYINSLKDKINKLEDGNATLMAKLEAMKCDVDNIPEDCTRGPWCRACEFGKLYHVTSDLVIPGSGNIISTICVCNKEKSCKNFVERRKED